MSGPSPEECAPDEPGPVVVTIVDLTTGERTTYEEPRGFYEYSWSEGNEHCDCNRGLYVSTAQGKRDPNRPCGDDRYFVRICAKDGRLLYEDHELSERGKRYRSRT